MTIPLTYVRHVVTTAGQTVFNVPSLVLPGAPFGGTIATLLVKVDGGTPPTYTHSTSLNQVTFLTGLPAGAVVEAWRTTPVNESLVSFPPATQWTPTHNNKSITQLLMCIQELHGAVEELRGNLSNYVNNAISSVFEFSGIAGATWSTTLDSGDTSLATPYSFTKGILMVGGSMYNLSDPSHVTLDNSGANTVINFLVPILGDHEAILIIF